MHPLLLINFTKNMNSKRFVVAYRGLPLINNHERLFPSVVLHHGPESVEILFHTNPIVQHTSEGPKANYDVCISSGEGAGEYNTVVLPRFDKPRQMSNLGALKTKYSSLMVPSIWSTPEQMDADPSSYDENQVIIKHLNGARGVCQLLIKGASACSKSTIFNNFKEALKSANVEQFSDKDKMLAKFKEKICVGPYADLVLAWSGIEERDMPMAAALKGADNYFMQVFAENVVEEYRVVNGVKNRIYYKRTYRADRPFPQATGGTASNLVGYDELTADSELNKTIDAFIKKEFGPLTSIDLFIARGKDKLYFGVFEYCNQYATAYDNPLVHLRMHQDFIVEQLQLHGFLESK